MFATKTMLITLALGATTLAQTSAEPFSGPTQAAGSGQTAGADLDDEVQPAPGRSVDPEPMSDRLLEIAPGTKLTRAGVTVSNDALSAGAILVGPLSGKTFDRIELRQGRRGTVDVSEDAQGLEFLQVEVKGRAFLTVTGEQGLGHYDPRDPYESRAGILISGQGRSALPTDEAATIEVFSSRNVIETEFGSREHEVVLHGSDNLVRMRGDDAVTVNAGTNRILSMWALTP